MTADKPRKPQTITRTTEYGYFIRKKLRKGKIRRQKTVKLPAKGKKVVLAKLNDIEIYVYPYDYPDKVFFGIYPLSTMIGEDDLSKLFGIYNKIRWYLKEEWTKKGDSRSKAKYPRQRIVNAYNAGLAERTEPK